MVNVHVDSQLCSTTKNLTDDITLIELCDKLYPITGILPQDMKLTFQSQGKVHDVVTYTSDTSDTHPLSKYKSLDRILVEDTNTESIASQLAQSSSTEEAYQLPEADYAKKHDTVLNWKKQNKLGRFNPEHQLKLDRESKLLQDHLQTLEVNQRCFVKSEGLPERRGWLRFVGKVVEINPNDVWCGVQFDEPVGKSNGFCKGRLYFGPIAPHHGGFIKPLNVETGSQYVPLPIDMEDLEEEDDEV